MSEYTVVKTPITDPDILRRALQDAGVPFEEAQGNTLSLVGYLGDTRPQKAQFVVRRNHLSSASNDLGYTWDETQRCFVAQISAYDTGVKCTMDVHRQVTQRAAYHQVVKTARQRGLAVVSETTASGHIQITLRG